MPFEWRGDRLTWHGASAEFVGRRVTWRHSTGAVACESEFVLAKDGVEQPTAATVHRLPERWHKNFLCAEVALELAADGALATVTLNAGGRPRARGAFLLSALEDGWELVCRHRHGPDWTVYYHPDEEPERTALYEDGLTEFRLPMHAGVEELVAPDTFGPSAIVDPGTSDNDASGDADAYLPSGLGGFGSIYIEDDAAGGDAGCSAAGFRWTSVDLTGASSITSAQLDFTRANNSDGAFTIRCKAEDAATPAVYATGSRPHSRTTVRSVSEDTVFTNDGNNVVVDASAMVDDLVTTAGYTYGGGGTAAMSFIFGAFDQYGIGTSTTVSSSYISRDVISNSGLDAAELTVVFSTSVLEVTLTATTPRATAAISGTAVHVTQLGADTPKATAALAGNPVRVVSLAADTPKATGELAANAVHVVSLAADTPKATAALAGNAVHVATLQGDTPKATAALSAEPVGSTAKAIGIWRTPPGIRRTSTAETVMCIVDAYHNLTDGEVEKVTFAVSENGGAATDHDVTARSWCIPNHSTYADPLNNAPAGRPVGWWAYGYAVDGAAVAAGYVDVTPTIHPTAGVARTLPTHRYYFDTDATDRRPCQGVRYVSPSGSDSNNGLSTSTPMATMWKALWDLAGVSRDAGGGTVYLMAGTHDLSAYSFLGDFPEFPFTSGQHWFHITTAPGVAREDVICDHTGDDGVPMRGHSSTQQTFRCRVSNIEMTPQGFGMGATGATVHLWVEHCLVRTNYWVEDGHYSLRMDLEHPGYRTFRFQDVAVVNATPWITGTEFRGVPSPNAYGNIMGCKFNTWIGVAASPSKDTPGSELNSGIGNCVFQYQRFLPARIVGVWKQRTFTTISVSNPTGTTFRYTVGGLTTQEKADFLEDFQELAASNGGTAVSTKWQFAASGCANAGNNGRRAATGAGADGSGNPWIEVTNASGVVESAGASITIEVQHATSGDRFEDVTGSTSWHSDVIKWDNQPAENHVCSHVRIVEADSPGTFRGSFGTTDGAFVNVFEALPTGNWDTGAPQVSCIHETDGTGSRLENVLVRDYSAKIQYWYLRPIAIDANCELVNAVIQNIEPGSGSALADLPPAMRLMSHIHVDESGDASALSGAGAVSVTSGASPWDVAEPGEWPAQALHTSAVGDALAWDRPAFLDTGRKGAWLNTLQDDWGDPPGDPEGELQATTPKATANLAVQVGTVVALQAEAPKATAALGAVAVHVAQLGAETPKATGGLNAGPAGGGAEAIDLTAETPKATASIAVQVGTVVSLQAETPRARASFGAVRGAAVALQAETPKAIAAIRLVTTDSDPGRPISGPMKLHQAKLLHGATWEAGPEPKRITRPPPPTITKRPF